MDVLLVAAKKDLIDDYCHVIREAGLNPVAVDVAAFAVENAYEMNYDLETERDQVIALVNIGAEVVNINVIQGGVPAFTRDITTGGNQYTEEIQKTVSISFEEAERLKIGDASAESSQDVVPQEVEHAIRSVTETVVGEISRSLDFLPRRPQKVVSARCFSVAAGPGSPVLSRASAIGQGLKWMSWTLW